MRVTGIVAGPFEVDFTTKCVQARWNRRLNARGISIFEPRAVHPAKAVDAWQWTILAGPATNLVLSVLLGLLNLTVFAGQPGAQVKLALVASVSAVVGAMSLIPETTGLTSSDGAILWRMWTNRPAAENDMRALLLGNWLASGTRPRDWAPANLAIADYVLNAPPDELDSTAKVAAVVYKYCYLADGGDLRGGLPVLETAVPVRTLWSQRTASDPIDLVIVLLARHYALWGNDATRARVLLDMLHPHSWVRLNAEWQMTTALVKLSQGDRVAATNHVAQARKQLKPLAGRSGVVTMESAWLDKAEKRISHQMTAPAVAPSALKAGNSTVKPEALASHRPPRLTAREPSPEQRLTRAARNAWQEVAVAVNQSLLLSSRQVVVEYGVDRSWLYRAPGIPLETKAAYARIPLSNPLVPAIAPRRLTAIR
jgi:hypothetical protein